MRVREFATGFALYACLIFPISAAVIYLWNLIRHGEGAFDWGTSLVLSIVFGVVLPLTNRAVGKRLSGDAAPKRKAHPEGR